MKNYLVIGASNGIGKAISEQLQREGHMVYGSYHSTQIESTDRLKAFPLDVQAEFTLDILPDSLDGIVYCPGTINLKPFKRISAEAFAQDFHLQVLGAIKVIQQTTAALQSSERPSIVLFSTVAVQSGYNFHSQVAVSKGAIEGLTKSLAAEFAPKIRVNALAPSLTDTPLAQPLLNSDKKRESNALRHPLKRIGSPTDLAEAACFLLSEKSSWITGQIIHVDGGMSTLKV